MDCPLSRLRMYGEEDIMLEGDMTEPTPAVLYPFLLYLHISMSSPSLLELKLDLNNIIVIILLVIII